MALDLASLASVRRFSEELARRLNAAELPPLHALVCNAGVQGARALTADGFEMTFGVNHLGHYLLVNLLLPSLTAPARIACLERISNGQTGENGSGDRQQMVSP